MLVCTIPYAHRWIRHFIFHNGIHNIPDCSESCVSHIIQPLHFRVPSLIITVGRLGVEESFPHVVFFALFTFFSFSTKLTEAQVSTKINKECVLHHAIKWKYSMCLSDASFTHKLYPTDLVCL